MSKKPNKPALVPNIPQDSLAGRLRRARNENGLTLDKLSEDSGLSKTYLWELENDVEGVKKPSADSLMKLVGPLRTTIADLLGLPTVQVNAEHFEISDSLKEFLDWMKKTERELSTDEVRDLAAMRFRGGQPKTRDDWDDLYRTLKRITQR
jgi:transcriptional regulator with XRE-family HTH domain